METEPNIIFEKKKPEIVLGINNLIQSKLHQDSHQSEDLSDLPSEISRVNQLDSLQSQKCSGSIWNALESVNLGSKYAYLYLGLLTDYDKEFKDRFFEFIKPCFEELKGNYDSLIALLKDCNINDLLKLITIFNFTVKEDKDKLNHEQKCEIIRVLRAKFSNIFASNNDYDFSLDLLIRRFLQFLEWKIDDVWKLDINFWTSLLNYHLTKKTFVYIFRVLSSHLNEATGVQSHNLIFRIISRIEQMKIPINQEFFWKQKEWTLWYMQFYLNDINTSNPKDFDQSKKEESGISLAISLFLSYITYKNRKHMQYLIDSSGLIKIFDYKLSEDIKSSLRKVVDLQLASCYPSRAFLERYFSFIKNEPNYEISKAQSVIIQLMLFSCLDINDQIKTDISDYAVNFFKHYYEYGIVGFTDDYSTVHNIFVLISQYLPLIWDEIAVAKNELKQKLGKSDPILQENRSMFWQMMKKVRKYRSILNFNIPDRFIRFIDSLIGYLHTGSEEFWNEMSDIVSNWNDGFNINSAEYTVNEYWAKVLISFCWNSNHLLSLKRFWEDKNNELRIEKEAKIPTVEEHIIEKKSNSHQENSTEIGNKNLMEDYSLLAPIDDSQDNNISQPINKEIATEEYKEYEETKQIETINPPISQQNKIWNQSDINLHIQLLEDLKSSLILKVLFDNTKPNQIKKYIISKLSNLFTLSIKNSHESKNFLIDTISFVIQLISKPIIKANDTQMSIFKELASSLSVKASLKNLGLDVDITKNYQNFVYFAKLPFDLAGITIFGGDILINSKFNDEIPLNLCAQKVVFIHELAHHIRKTSNGFYNINNKTPESKNRNLKKGAPGSKKKTILPYKNEGVRQAECELFGVYLTKICDKQIDFLNSTRNWNETLDDFILYLEDLYSKNSIKYQLGRGSDGLYSLERRGHNDN